MSRDIKKCVWCWRAVAFKAAAEIATSGNHCTAFVDKLKAAIGGDGGLHALGRAVPCGISLQDR